jgi:hypothetical protein
MRLEKQSISKSSSYIAQARRTCSIVRHVGSVFDDHEFIKSFSNRQLRPMRGRFKRNVGLDIVSSYTRCRSSRRRDPALETVQIGLRKKYPRYNNFRRRDIRSRAIEKRKIRCSVRWAVIVKKGGS